MTPVRFAPQSAVPERDCITIWLLLDQDIETARGPVCGERWLQLEAERMKRKYPTIAIVHDGAGFGCLVVDGWRDHANNPFNTQEHAAQLKKQGRVSRA